MRSFAWACEEAMWCYYDLVRGIQVPFPSLADVGFLGAVPLTVVGLLALSGGTNRSTRQLLWLAAEMFAGLAVFFAGWAALAGLVSHRPVHAILSPVVGMTYPMSDLVIAAMVVVAFRRATRDRVSFAFVLAGILSFTIADSSFSYFTATNSYGIGNGLDTGWVLGYLLVALGAMWAIQQRRLADNSAAFTPAGAFTFPCPRHRRCSWAQRREAGHRAACLPQAGAVHTFRRRRRGDCLAEPGRGPG